MSSLSDMPPHIDYCPHLSIDNCLLSGRLQRRYTVTTMEKTFRSAFLAHLEKSGESVANISRKSGVSKYQLDKLKQREGAKTNVEDAIKVAAAFGLSLDAFLDEPQASSQAEIVSLYNQLSSAEQEMILAAARALAERGSQGND